MNKSKRIRSSILERLIDNEPNITFEPEKLHHQKIEDLRVSVRKDLEHLLNTRIRVLSPDKHLTELDDSILNYGLPDLSTINLGNVTRQQEFMRSLEKTLKTYEPRFKSVKVTASDDAAGKDRVLRFRVKATIYADPAPDTGCEMARKNLEFGVLLHRLVKNHIH